VTGRVLGDLPPSASMLIIKSYFMWDLQVVKTKLGPGVARNKKARVVAFS
jgi:hypothetical protein